MIGLSPGCYIQSFVETGLPVPEKKALEGFLPYMGVVAIFNFSNFRKQRNLVTKLKRKSANQYFIERCVVGSKTKDFWSTVKPFLTNKGTHFQKDTILFEEGKLVNDQQEICDIFLTFFL